MTSLIKETGPTRPCTPSVMKCFRRRAAFEVARALGRRQTAGLAVARLETRVASSLSSTGRSSCGRSLELSPRDPDDAPSGGDQSLIAAAIGLERLFVPWVCRPSVSTTTRRSRHAKSALIAGPPSPGSIQTWTLGVGEAQGAGQGQEGLLELVLGRGACRCSGFRGRGGLSWRRGGWRCGRAARGSLFRSRHLDDLGLVEGTLELTLVDDLGQVEQGAGEAGAPGCCRPP